MFDGRKDLYKLIVIEDRASGKIVGSGTIMMERKFIHETGIVGHIEDIVIDQS